jgi:hypothetical protein
MYSLRRELTAESLPTNKTHTLQVGVISLFLRFQNKDSMLKTKGMAQRKVNNNNQCQREQLKR